MSDDLPTTQVPEKRFYTLDEAKAMERDGKGFVVHEPEAQHTMVLTVKVPIYGNSTHMDKAVQTIRRMLQVSLANPDIEVTRADPSLP